MLKQDTQTSNNQMPDQMPDQANEPMNQDSDQMGTTFPDLLEMNVKHIKKIEAQPAKTVANASGNGANSGKSSAPVLGGGCIPVGI